MSLEEKIFDKIFSSGVSGLKKTDLTKEFASVDLDNILNTWIKQNKIIISKKGSTNYCWHKDSYFQYLVDSDPKFKYTLELLKEVQISFKNLSTSIDRHVEKLEGKMIVLMDSILATTTNNHTFENSIPNPQKVINLQRFSEDFDLTICKYSDSIGWVPLATLRNDLSIKYEISENEFYTGGNEGIMIRGLVYGYVRCL